MAVGREIKTKIASIKNTQKITGAMEMVAASKMRKAQDRMLVLRAYANRLKQVAGHIANSHSEYHHRYLQQNDNPKRVGFIVVTSDRGLCGGLNINLMKVVLREMKRLKESGVDTDLCTIGTKGQVFFRRIGANILGGIRNIGDKPTVDDLIGVAKVMMDHFDNGEIDAIHLCYNKFVNTMTQQPVIEQLLPLKVAKDESSKRYWDYIYEPDAKELLDALLMRFVETQVYQGTMENIASEQSARMVAMKNATDNAGDLISELQQVYNKARQASITQEITEIVSGAEAV